MDLKVLRDCAREKSRSALIFDRKGEDDLLLLPEVTQGVLTKEGEESLRLFEKILGPSSNRHSEIPRSGKRMMVVVR